MCSDCTCQLGMVLFNMHFPAVGILGCLKLENGFPCNLEEIVLSYLFEDEPPLSPQNGLHRPWGRVKCQMNKQMNGKNQN